MILKKLKFLKLLNTLNSFYNHKIYSRAMVAFAGIFFIIFLSPFFIDLDGYKPEIENQLKLIYDNESSNFGTLFNFTDGSVSLNNFRDESHFIDSYPFIPFQFTLFRESIKGLSDHNAFEGKHASVGERSLLGVFRDVSIAISSKPLGAIAPFDMMYSGISSVLKTFIQSSIQVAESN